MLYNDYYEIYFISILFLRQVGSCVLDCLLKQFMNKNPFSVLPSAMFAFLFRNCVAKSKFPK